MLLRTLANVLPRQSVSPAISWSIRSDGFIGSLCLEFLSRFHPSFRCSLLLGRSLRNKSSKDMAFPHPKSREDHYRNEDIPSSGGIVWNLVKRTINIAEYRNGKDEVNPAKNRTFDALVHDLLDSRLLSHLRRRAGRFNTRGPQQHAVFVLLRWKYRTALRTPHVAAASRRTSSPRHQRCGRWAFR